MITENISHEYEYYLQVTPAIRGMSTKYIQLGMCGQEILHRQVDIADATPFVYREARLAQEFMRSTHHIEVEIVA